MNTVILSLDASAAQVCGPHTVVSLILSMAHSQWLASASLCRSLSLIAVVIVKIVDLTLGAPAESIAVAINADR